VLARMTTLGARALRRSRAAAQKPTGRHRKVA
jgi:hypothetical protein